MNQNAQAKFNALIASLLRWEGKQAIRDKTDTQTDKKLTAENNKILQRNIFPYPQKCVA